MFGKKRRNGRLEGATSSRKHEHRLKFEPLESRFLLSVGPLYISEFLTDNATGLIDQDGDHSDWIEIHNPTQEAVDLAGWHLTDDADDPAKWDFPDVTLDGGGYLTVFASGKDRQDPASELHTNFQLDNDGEYLALIYPDGGTVSHEFAPKYPDQREDFSYGLQQESTTLLGEETRLSFRVPTSGDAALGTDWTEIGFDDSDWSGNSQTSPILITEAATGKDDWLEIQNVSNYEVVTDGWVIVTNWAQPDLQTGLADINNFHTPHVLPTSMGPREVLYRTDEFDDAANYFGENIWWKTDGNGWVMVVDGQGQVADFVAWGYTESEIASLYIEDINGSDVFGTDIWSAMAVDHNEAADDTLSFKRTGNLDHDLDSDFVLTAPQSPQVQNSGMVVPFPGTAPLARTGVGFSTDPWGFEVTLFKADEPIEDLATAEAIIADPARQVYTETEAAATINYLNTGNRAHFSADRAFPGLTTNDDVDQFVIRATATVTIPEPGPWSFGVNSNDGFGLELTNGTDVYTMSYSGTREAADTTDIFNIVEAGTYQLRLVAFENEGEAGLELFAAQGNLTAFANAHDLIGNVAGGGLAVAGFSGAIQADIEAEMHGVNASVYVRVPFAVEDPTQFDALILRMKYNDGFVAYLNGQEVARRNAPESPQWNSAAQSEQLLESAQQYEDINISAALGNLRVGDNVLAIHGLNHGAADADFLALPQVVGTKLVHENRFFAAPTPGTNNAEGFLGFVADTKFSVDRRFLTQVEHVEITSATPGATIRYTVNGTEPTERNGIDYVGPLRISRTIVLRAAAFKDGYWPTNVDTNTYISTTDVVRQSSLGQAPAPGWPTGSVNGQTINYGMDPDIVNDPQWGPLMADSLLSLPAMSLVTDLDNLFDQRTGIFVNPRSDGMDWERPASLELIYPEGASGPGFPDGDGEGFQINAGVRIRGGYSRSGSNPKHAFRFFFRREYGDTKLDYPLFGDEGTDRFDKVDLRTSQNYSWAFGGPNNNTMVREVYSRDLQGELEQPYTRSRYYHLYINGQYWGVFQTQERSEAQYAASYYGGDPDDWDVIKQDDSREIGATDGNTDAYYRLWQATIAGYASNTAYYRAQGMNPDGTPNPAYERLLDVDNLIDYMIITYYTGDRDGPGSRFTAPNPNNYYAAYNRENPDGWKFFEHDSEHSLGTGEENMVSPLLSNNSARRQFRYFNAHWLHEQLCTNRDYKQRFADRVYEQFFNGGTLTYENSLARVNDRAEQIDLAMIAESARWGDMKVSTPKDYDDWLANVDMVRNWIVTRTTRVINQIKTVGWYPNVNAPIMNQHGGEIPSGFQLQLSGGGSVYYMLDGSDPRTNGGGLHRQAIAYTGNPIELTESTLVKARRRSGTTWSPLAAAQFYIGQPAAAGNLAVTELNYHPYDPTPAELAAEFDDKDLFEFIELMNVSDTAVDLTDVQITRAVTFSFTDSSVTELAPGQRAVVVRDMAAFEARYGAGINVAGTFENGLSNGGERIEILDHNGEPIQDFEYNDSGSWPGRADGTGSTLEVVDTAADYNLSATWRSSSEYGGSPGQIGVGPRTDVVVNEVLTHTDEPLLDSIELLNTTGQAIDLGGWYISDDKDDLRKYRIPDGTTILAGGYLIFDESHFNPTPLDPLANHFSLSGAHGDDVWLTEAAASGLRSFVQHVEFGPAAQHETFGRWPNATGGLYPMTETTLGAENSGPRIGPLVISEIAYNPTTPDELADPNDFEFVEIINPTATAVDLTNWRIRKGIDYDFEPGTPLASGGLLVAVAFDPVVDTAKLQAFRDHYQIDDSVAIVGPYSGQLNDDGERVQLQRPDTPPAGEAGYYPRLTEDDVVYGDLGGWPTTPDGGGDSLHRAGAGLWGSDPANWTAATPTPGTADLQASDDAYEPNDTLADAYDLSGHQQSWLSTIAGEGVQANDDWYRIDVPAEQRRLSVELSFSHAAGNIDLQLVNSAGDVRISANSTTDIEQVDTVLASPGTWYLRVHGDNSGNTYDLQFETQYAHPGDANLDGVTDLSDFNIWNANKFKAGTPWQQGDFNADGATDLSDFNIWNAYKFTQAPDPAPINDAVLAETAGEIILGQESLLGDLAWLDELQRTQADARSTGQNRPTDDAVDRLLASYWP